MKTQGKFILMSLDEFKIWLPEQVITRQIKLIQNHHTWLPDYANFFKRPNGMLWSESMEKSHLSRGFSQIAQNLTTFPDGTICVCRPLNIQPAGSIGANAGGICIEHLGNFDKGEDVMTPAHAHTIVQVNALLCKKFRLQVNKGTIVYHHWYNLKNGDKWVNETDIAPADTKTCPGTNFFGGNTVHDAEKNFYPLIVENL